MEPPNDAVGFWGAAFGGAIGVAAFVWRTLTREAKADEETRKATTASIPAIMQGLAAAGTPMPALRVDIEADLLKTAELNLAAMKVAADALTALRDELRLHREAAERNASAVREGQREQVETLRRIEFRLAADSELERERAARR